MPELPEVETICRGLQKVVRGQRIERVRVVDGRVVRNMTAAAFARRLRGAEIRDVRRRGKAVIFALSPAGDFLVVQLMMTGQLIYDQGQGAFPATKVIFHLSNSGRVLYNDHRLFGRLQVVRDLDEIPYFRILGPEPLARTFDRAGFVRGLADRRLPVKSLLMDHRFVAGIGNIYASEILAACGIRPERPAGSLTGSEQDAVYQAVIGVLRDAVRARGTSINTYRDGDGMRGRYQHALRVYGRDGQACRVCGQTIERVVLSGRSTFFCPGCQH